VYVRHARGEVIYREGQVLSSEQFALAKAERAHALARGTLWQRLLLWGGVAGACAAVIAGLAAYAVLFVPRLRGDGRRSIGLAVMMLASFASVCAAGVWRSEWMVTAAVVSVALVTLLTCIGHDRRSALAFGLLQAVLVAIALRLDAAGFAVLASCVACVVASLREVRDRSSLVRTGLASALGTAGAVLIFGAMSRPLHAEGLREMVRDAVFAGVGVLAVAGLALFALPVIERVFRVTTGMTLGELRDPRQPLLKELQLRAPGTYTHSLNVATIAEQAAEAVGADSLLTYVGALYHDVGKMNKPDYFVENMVGAVNKHDKLSPAMSLLIVVGHVKDGVELAREFRLPGRVLHFVEAHHGTTLVEYFFHRARTQASATDRDGDGAPDDAIMPDESQYRYPGPKPRTKEVAIVMIADAVESASRAMVDPTPARIEALVREVAHKRLSDGQFDDCELTLKDLNRIVESIARTVTSMHHTRVAYPGSGAPSGPRTPHASKAGGDRGEEQALGRGLPQTNIIKIPEMKRTDPPGVT
jgi:hypothetical protein